MEIQDHPVCTRIAEIVQKSLCMARRHGKTQLLRFRQLWMSLSPPHRYMPDHVAIRATGAVLFIAFVAMITLVAKSPNLVVYDEPYFANYISLLHQYGFTPRFLNSLNAAPGPLSAFVQVIFEPLTQLQPVRMRFVNVLTLVALVLILVMWLKRVGNNYWVAGFSVLIVPMTWVVGGMALSEMSAMMFASLSMYLQLRGLDAFGAGRSALAWFLVAGVFLGIAIWGRQPYLLLGGVPAIIALAERRLSVPVVIFFGASGCIAIPLFIIWRGFVAPSQHLAPSFSVQHGLLSFGYTGICFILLGARSRWLPAKVAIGLVAITIMVNASLSAYTLYPVRSIVDRYLAPSVMPLYGNVSGSLFLSCGVLFLAVLLRITWESRKDLKKLTVNSGLLCVAAAPLFDTHQFSSRYTAMSLPYLILAVQPWRQWKLETVMTAWLGCVLGFLSLYGYFSFSY